MPANKPRVQERGWCQFRWQTHFLLRDSAEHKEVITVSLHIVFRTCLLQWMNCSHTTLQSSECFHMEEVGPDGVRVDHCSLDNSFKRWLEDKKGWHYR